MPIIMNVGSASRTRVGEMGEDAREMPVDPFLADYHADLGPRTSEALETVIAEVGIDAVSSRNLSGRTFNFAEGTALGFRLEEQVHTPRDAYVTDSEVRSAALERLKRDSGGRKVAFVETSGVTELGGGFVGGSPLAVTTFGAVGWGYGVTASALFRYRRSVPVVLGFGERPLDAANRRQLTFPFSAKSALKMLPGSEVELTGQGRVSAAVGVSGAVGLALPHVATAGLGGTIGASASTKGEINLNVLALDRPGMVRVTIRKLDEEGASFLARLRLGLNFSAGSITGPIAGGMLRFYVEKLGAANFEEIINLYTTLNASIFASMAHRGTHVGSWDFDLSKPEARQAYEALVRLDRNLAESLDKIEGSGVSEIKIDENEAEFRVGADVGMLGQKLLLYETLLTEREGRLSSRDGEKLIYRDSIFTRRKKSILTGSQQISWEAVSIRKPDKNMDEPFLHLNWQQRDWDFGQNQVSRTLRFAEALEIPRNQMVGDEPDSLVQATKRLTQLQEVNLSTDIYFTKKGIENIDKADATQAKEAFLKVSSMVRKKFKAMDFGSNDATTTAALELIAEYRSLTGIENISKASARLKVLPVLRAEYRRLTGRRISVDARLIADAENFGRIVETLNDTRNPQQVASFFQEIGRGRRFHYMQSVAALALLAGPEHTLINQLSISGKGVSIANQSEGNLRNPRETVARFLHRRAGTAAA